MNLPRLEKVWSTIGVALFFIGGVLLGIGRFGPGVLLMVGCIICLGSAMGASRRRKKRDQEHP